MCIPSSKSGVEWISMIGISDVLGIDTLVEYWYISAVIVVVSFPSSLSKSSIRNGFTRYSTFWLALRSPFSIPCCSHSLSILALGKLTSSRLALSSPCSHFIPCRFWKAHGWPLLCYCSFRWSTALFSSFCAWKISPCLSAVSDWYLCWDCACTYPEKLIGTILNHETKSHLWPLRGTNF